MADRYYLGPWVWDTGSDTGPHWRAPEGCVGLLDLRSIPDQSVAGGSPLGYGLFVLPDTAPDPGSDYRQIGDALDARIDPMARGLIGSQLGTGPLESPRLNALIYELLTVKADHTGDTFARPLMPGRRGRMGYGLAGVRGYDEAFQYDSIQHTAALQQLREQYREDRRASLNGERLYRGVPDLEHYRRCLNVRRNKLGLPWHELVPPEFTGDPGPTPERTIITDDFNRASLGSNWTVIDGSWSIDSSVELFNNTSSSATSIASIRYDATDLSSSDHYTQIVFVSQSSPDAWMTGMVRFSPSVHTAYFGIIRGSDSLSTIRKIVADTPTVLVTGSGGASAPHTGKLQIDGSSLELFKDAASIETVTDTAIPSGTRVGVNSHPNFDITSKGDDFEAADLAAVADIRPGNMDGGLHQLTGGLQQ